MKQEGCGRELAVQCSKLSEEVTEEGFETGCDKAPQNITVTHPKV
jgi:hypothetical protein